MSIILDLPVRAMQQTIAIGNNLGLLVIGIILIVLGAMMPKAVPQLNILWTILLIFGVIAVVVYFVLLIAGIVL